MRPDPNIRSLRILGERNDACGFGLAFDDLDTGVVPEPGVSLPLGCGIALPARATRPGAPTAE